MRSMLYSLALRGSTMADLAVAGGTIFNEVQLWAPSDAPPRPDPDPDPDLADAEDDARRPGRYSADTREVSCASRGRRTARTCFPPRTIEPRARGPSRPATYTRDAAIVAARLVAFGHTARVWDCRAANAGERPLLVTAGEDCTVRLWDAPADLVPGVIQSGPVDASRRREDVDGDVGRPRRRASRPSRSRGVARVDPSRENGLDVLVTAGADASIKLWDLSEHADVGS